MQQPAGLPDSLQQRGLADTFVSRNQRQAFRPRRCANEAVYRVSRIIIGKLSGKRRNFRSDRFDSDTRTFQKMSHCVLDRAARL